MPPNSTPGTCSWAPDFMSAVLRLQVPPGRRVPSAVTLIHYLQPFLVAEGGLGRSFGTRFEESQWCGGAPKRQ